MLMNQITNKTYLKYRIYDKDGDIKMIEDTLIYYIGLMICENKLGSIGQYSYKWFIKNFSENKFDLSCIDKFKNSIIDNAKEDNRYYIYNRINYNEIINFIDIHFKLK